MGKPAYKNGFQVTVHEEIFDNPLSLKKPSLIFVNSMSDLFHDDIPIDVILRLFNVMQEAHWHTFQVLTKRSERLEKIGTLIDWPDNVWVGVSVEDNDYKYRIDHLRKLPAKIKFISFEPLLGLIDDVNLSKIDWVIVGGESGPKSRKMDEEWAIRIRDICLKQKVPFYFKQWGGFNKKKNGRLLDGLIWNQMPERSIISLPTQL